MSAEASSSAYARGVMDGLTERFLAAGETTADAILRAERAEQSLAVLRQALGTIGKLSHQKPPKGKLWQTHCPACIAIAALTTESALQRTTPSSSSESCAVLRPPTPEGGAE